MDYSILERVKLKKIIYTKAWNVLEANEQLNKHGIEDICREQWTPTRLTTHEGGTNSIFSKIRSGLALNCCKMILKACLNNFRPLRSPPTPLLGQSLKVLCYLNKFPRKLVLENLKFFCAQKAISNIHEKFIISCIFALVLLYRKFGWFHLFKSSQNSIYLAHKHFQYTLTKKSRVLD